MQLNDFLKLVNWEQMYALKHMSAAEKEALLDEMGDYIYDIQQEMYEEGRRPIEPDRAKIETYDVMDVKDPDMERLKHYQEEIEHTFESEGLEAIREAVEVDEFGKMQNIDQDQLKKAFEIADDLMKQAQQLDLPYDDTYELMKSLYPHIGKNISDTELIQRGLNDMRAKVKSWGGALDLDFFM